MKISAERIARALPAIGKLATIPLPYRKAREIKRLKDEFQKEAALASESCVRLMSRFGGLTSSDGNCRFQSAEEADGFAREYAEEFNSEIDIAADVCDLSDFTHMITLDADSLTLLEGIVVFEKEA